MKFDHDAGGADAANFLVTHGYCIKHGCIYHPDGKNHIETDDEADAIDWLCEEYDYCFEFGKPVSNVLFQ